MKKLILLIVLIGTIGLGDLYASNDRVIVSTTLDFLDIAMHYPVSADLFL